MGLQCIPPFGILNVKNNCTWVKGQQKSICIIRFFKSRKFSSTFTPKNQYEK